MSKEIPLSLGYVSLVDDEDYDYLNQWKWHYCDGYARRNVYEKGSRKPIPIRMHRVILNANKGEYVDHINGNRINNQKENLRLCTYSQNNMNKKRHSDSKSNYKGVSKHRSKWRATITKEYKTYYLGLYKTDIEAAIAYNEKATELFGEFAVLNDIGDIKK